MFNVMLNVSQNPIPFNAFAVSPKRRRAWRRLRRRESVDGWRWGGCRGCWTRMFNVMLNVSCNPSPANRFRLSTARGSGRVGRPRATGRRRLAGIEKCLAE